MIIIFTLLYNQKLSSGTANILVSLPYFAYSVVDCGHPGTPSNGSSNFISTILDATVTHSCDSGHVLCTGDETRTCQPDMSWSGILPNCISKLLYTFNLQ